MGSSSAGRAVQSCEASFGDGGGAGLELVGGSACLRSVRRKSFLRERTDGCLFVYRSRNFSAELFLAVAKVFFFHHAKCRDSGLTVANCWRLVAEVFDLESNCPVRSYQWVEDRQLQQQAQMLVKQFSSDGCEWTAVQTTFVAFKSGLPCLADCLQVVCSAVHSTNGIADGFGIRAVFGGSVL